MTNCPNCGSAGPFRTEVDESLAITKLRKMVTKHGSDIPGYDNVALNNGFCLKCKAHFFYLIQ